MFISFFDFSRNIVAVNIILIETSVGLQWWLWIFYFQSLSFCKQVLSIGLIKTEILADSKHKSRKKSWG